MTDLTKANRARLNAALDKKWRFPHGVDTYRGMIERQVFSHGECVDVPRVKYNRRKFNRMDYAQQAEYERKLAETKTEYRLFYAGDAERCMIVPKMVFDFFTDINRKHSFAHDGVTL